LPAIVVEEMAQAKERRRRWTVAKGHKMAKGTKKSREGENAKGL
jgi:trehalose utilization protein